MNRSEKKEKDSHPEGRILNTELEYIEDLGPCISLTIGFREISNSDATKMKIIFDSKDKITRIAAILRGNVFPAPLVLSVGDLEDA